MATVIDRLPFYEDRSTLHLPPHLRDETIVVQRFQIIVWASIAQRELGSLDSRTPRFPVVLDTGYNHNLLISEDQLRRWACVDLRSLPHVGTIHPWGQRTPVLAADVWLHRNVPRTRDEPRPDSPHCLELDNGIAVTPAGAKNVPLSRCLVCGRCGWPTSTFRSIANDAASRSARRDGSESSERGRRLAVTALVRCLCRPSAASDAPDKSGHFERAHAGGRFGSLFSGSSTRRPVHDDL